jgi:hypothetical protein
MPSLKRKQPAADVSYPSRAPAWSIAQRTAPVHPLVVRLCQVSSLGRPLGTFAGFTTHSKQGHRIVRDQKYAIPGMAPAPAPAFGCEFCPRKFLTSPALTSHTKSKHKFAVAEEAKARRPETFFSGSRSVSLIDLTSSPTSSARSSASPPHRTPSVKQETTFGTSRSWSRLDLTPSPASSPSAFASPPRIKREPLLASADAMDYDSEATQAYDPDPADVSDGPAGMYEDWAPLSPRSASFFDIAQTLSIPFDQPLPGDYTSHLGDCFPMNRVRPEVVSDRSWWWRRRTNMAQRRRDRCADEAEARGPRGHLYADPETPLFERAGLTDGPLLEQEWAALIVVQRLSTTFYEGLWIELDAEMFGAVTVSAANNANSPNNPNNPNNPSHTTNPNNNYARCSGALRGRGG